MEQSVQIPDMDSLRCSVVVTVSKHPVFLRDVLDTLSQQSEQASEVILVFPIGSKELTSAERRMGEHVKARSLNIGCDASTGALSNAGLRSANGEVVLFLNDSTITDHDFVERHMRIHRSSTGSLLAVIGHAVLNRHAPPASYLNLRLYEFWNSEQREFPSHLQVGEADPLDEENEKSLRFGQLCSIRREVFANNGGFNEALEFPADEQELGIRLYRAGVDIYCDPRPSTIQIQPSSLEDLFRNKWRLRAVHDAFRVIHLKQHNAQTGTLASMFRGHPLNRLLARLAWHLSKPLLSTSRFLARAANATQRESVFRLWLKTTQSAEYWQQVQSAGYTLRQLKSVAGSSKCAVMLHNICDPLVGDEAKYHLTPHRFQELMNRFDATGFKTSTTDQWILGEDCDSHALLTFDDGYADLYQELLPLVIERGYTPVVYLVADRIGLTNVWDRDTGLAARKLLTIGQIREMQRYGVEFGSHTLSHPRLPMVSDDQLFREVSESKLRIEDMIGVEVKSFAYPYGEFNRRVRSAVALAGYQLAFTAKAGLNGWNDPLCQRRVEVNNFTSILNFSSQLRYGYPYKQVLKHFCTPFGAKSISERL